MKRLPSAASVALTLALLLPAAVQAQTTTLPTGKRITLPPLGPSVGVGSLPMNMIATPDNKFALASDMGFREKLSVLRTSDGSVASQVTFGDPATFPNLSGLYYGLAVAANGDGTYAVYAAQGGAHSIAVLSLSAAGVLSLTGAIAMQTGDFPAGLALDSRGYLYVANNEFYLNGHDPREVTTPGSLVVYNARVTPGAPVSELARLPLGAPGNPGPFPLAVAATANQVFVTSQRDGVVYAVNTANPSAPRLSATIPVGAHPVGLTLNQKQTRLYVANAHSDTVSVIDAEDDSVVSGGTILLRPAGATDIAGVSPVSVALSPNDATLYVSLGDMNAVAVVNAHSNHLDGYIPTGWYPSAVVAAPFRKLLIASAKGVQTRYPNPGYTQGSFNDNPQYGLNLIEGTVSFIAAPNSAQLHAQTQQVLDNNKITSTTGSPPNSLAGIGIQAGKIKHVVYIVKENRTYDQVLGDLPQGNGDSSLTLFGKAVTPNQHALASRFVLLDNFYDCGEASGDGWPWSTQGIANEYVIKNLPYNYSGRGRNYDFEGTNNNYVVGGFPSTDPYGGPILPLASGPAQFSSAPPIPDVSEAPGRAGASGGHVWDNVRDHGLSYRNYGFFYAFGDNKNLPDNYPAARGLQPAGHDGGGISDFDYRRYDNNYPDSDAPSVCYAQTGDPHCLYKVTQYGHYAVPSRFSEFKREFGQMLAKDSSGASVPNFLTVRFNHDHTQGMASGAHSPRSEVADNDYAVGQFVDLISHSPIWSSTAIFVIEDDAQDGPDHVDSHRSTCYVISPFIKQNSVDHTFYNTDSVLKTMEQLLGLPPMSQYDAVASTILDFDTAPTNAAPYAATMPAKSLIAEINPSQAAMSRHDPRLKLVKLSDAMDFVHPDSAPAALLNQILWKSVKGVQSRMPLPRKAFAPAIQGKVAVRDADGG